MLIKLLWVSWIVFGCWAVSRSIVWLPERMAEDESSFVAELMALHQVQPPWPPPARQLSAIGSFVSVLPSASIQTLGWIVASVLVAFWAMATYGLDILAMLWALLGWGLLILAGVDAKTKLLPDALTLSLLWLGMLMQLFAETRTVGIELSVVGAVAGYLPLWLLAQAYRLVRGRDGLGMGDLKLLAAMGAWSGPFVLPQVLLLAALLAIAVFLLERMLHRTTGGFYEERPFGPAIVAAYFIVMLFTQ